MATREELLALAERCIDGQVGVYEFAYAVARARGVSVEYAMFVPCLNGLDARLRLKSAETAAGRPRE